MEDGVIEGFIFDRAGGIFVKFLVLLIGCLLAKVPLETALPFSFGLAIIVEFTAFILKNIFKQFNVTRKAYSIVVAIALLVGMAMCSTIFAVLLSRIK
jgi:hypothetical protein